MECWLALAMLVGINTATAEQKTDFHGQHRVAGKIEPSHYVH